MWSNVISLDKSYGRETDYIKSMLSKINLLSFAVEESKNRNYFYLASICENQSLVEEKLFDMLEVVVLSFMKIDFIKRSLPSHEMTYSFCALLSALSAFDSEFERQIVRKTLAESSCLNIDGLFNFRMKEMALNWKDLSALASKIIMSNTSKDDVFDIAGFISSTDGNKCQLILCNDGLTNLTEQRQVAVDNVFDKTEFNLLHAIIKQQPSEIVVKDKFEPEFVKTLSYIANVI